MIRYRRTGRCGALCEAMFVDTRAGATPSWSRISFFASLDSDPRAPMSGWLQCKPGVSQEGRLSMEIHKEVDARGLNCPLPILRAKKALADMQSGQILKVLATDPGSQRDFAAFAKQTGNEIVESSTHEKTFIFLMRRR
jgi:TusA-related sulfurtransferase